LDIEGAQPGVVSRSGLYVFSAPRAEAGQDRWAGHKPGRHLGRQDAPLSRQDTQFGRTHISVGRSHRQGRPAGTRTASGQLQDSFRQGSFDKTDHKPMAGQTK
jgi:hypothetical protein